MVQPVERVHMRVSYWACGVGGPSLVELRGGGGLFSSGFRMFPMSLNSTFAACVTGIVIISLRSLVIISLRSLVYHLSLRNVGWPAGPGSPRTCARF